MAVATAVAGWPGMTFGVGRPRSVEREEPEVSLERTVEAPTGVGVRASDDELVARLAAQDAAAEAALAELYDRYSGAVYGLALRMLSERTVAEEVRQETFWRLWRFAARYEPGRVRFITWLLRVATNLAISEQRRRGRRPRTSPLVPPQTLDCEGEAPAPVDVVDPDPDVPDQV